MPSSHSQSDFNEKMFALIQPPAANECWPACHSPWGPTESGLERWLEGGWRGAAFVHGRHGGVALREQPRGLKFPTPRCRFCCLDYI